MLNKAFSVIILSLFFTSCIKEKIQTRTEVQTVTVTKLENTWGMEYKSQLVEEENNPIIKDASKAVAIIEDINGSTATGFFISPDGYFLTNEHVVSKTRCSESQCFGFKIIRDFRVNGAIEVFNDVKLIMNDSNLDFAILKVDTKNKNVPFLRLQYNKKEFDGSVLYKIIGHPFGSALRTNDAYLRDANDTSFALTTTAISGNSGSPMVNSETGEVEGLYVGGSWDKSTIKKDGSILHISQATQIGSIIDLISLGFDIYDNPKEGIYFERTPSVNKAFDFFPQTNEDLLLYPTLDSWVGVFAYSSESNKYLNMILNNLKNKYDRNPTISRDELSDLISTVVAVQKSNYAFEPFNEENLKLIKTMIRAEAASELIPLYQISRKEPYERCQTRIKKDETELQKLYLAGKWCNSIKTIDGKNVLVELARIIKNTSENEQFAKNRAFMKVINTQLSLVKSITPEVKEVLIGFIERLSARENVQTYLMYNEQLIAKILNIEKL